MRGAMLLSILVAACGPQGPSNTNQGVASSDACMAGSPDGHVCDPANTKKTTICHIPPGNPANQHTLCVGNASVKAHLAHGDHLGACDVECTPSDDGGATGGTTGSPPIDTTGSTSSTTGSTGGTTGGTPGDDGGTGTTPLPGSGGDQPSPPPII